MSAMVLDDRPSVSSVGVGGVALRSVATAVRCCCTGVSSVSAASSGCAIGVVEIGEVNCCVGTVEGVTAMGVCTVRTGDCSGELEMRGCTAGFLITSVACTGSSL